MLIGVDPLLGPDLLSHLRAMGHGDEIAIVDANFPAEAIGRRVCRLAGVQATRALQAVTSVLPLDDFTPCAVRVMAVVGAPDETPPVVAAFGEILEACGYAGETARLSRDAFYERARQAFCVVATGEGRLYGNVILTKGVVPPDGEGRA